MKKLLVFAVFTCMSTSIFAQDVSLSESVDYITKKLLTFAPSFADTYSGEVVGEDTCYYEITQYWTNRGSTTKYKFRFEDIDPEDLEIRYFPHKKTYHMYLRTKNRNEKIYKTDEIKSGFISSAYISSDDKETLERVKKAFISAINHCEDSDPFAD